MHDTSLSCVYRKDLFLHFIHSFCLSNEKWVWTQKELKNKIYYHPCNFTKNVAWNYFYSIVISWWVGSIGSWPWLALWWWEALSSSSVFWWSSRLLRNHAYLQQGNLIVYAILLKELLICLPSQTLMDLQGRLYDFTLFSDILCRFTDIPQSDGTWGFTYSYNPCVAFNGDGACAYGNAAVSVFSNRIISLLSADRLASQALTLTINICLDKPQQKPCTLTQIPITITYSMTAVMTTGINMYTLSKYPDFVYEC